ncbi:hypothetical protein B0H63DRAFT_489672 [Podospora didyma]|uniref:Uncharacterized protein n=1 Tax=Podospora didyma TaxID=330526 RepID=A0AAE0K132_9PEZI|nr:hypothetical protein B0H63DRAFT_489672 [Podospora didyma]
MYVLAFCFSLGAIFLGDQVPYFWYVFTLPYPWNLYADLYHLVIFAPPFYVVLYILGSRGKTRIERWR